MRLTKLIFLLVALLLLPGTALAEPQEQLILRQISVGSFDIWQHTNGTWQDTDDCGKRDYYGWKGKELKPETFTLPQTQYTSGFTITKVNVVKMDGSFTMTDKELKNAGRSEDWINFKENYLRYLPNNYKVEKTDEDLAQGKAIVQKTLDLMPMSLDLKDPAIRAELGMADRDFSDLAQGWRWYTPILIEWYGVPKEQQINLVASSIDPAVPDEAEPGKTYTSTVKFKYFGTIPVNDVPIGAYNGQYRATLKKNGQPITRDNFNPGDVKTYTFNWTAPPSGETELRGVIDTPPLPDTYKESSEQDNTVKVTVFVKEPPQPSTPGSLTFQAVNQDRSATRPAGTAKWTDWVTATLKPPSPKPPKGTLTSWQVTSAKLTYPKKNSDFTFGTPYGPIGTTTVSMKPNGQKATVEFQEDWGMDGAKIYSLIEYELMAESPKDYTITASYTVEFKYEYRVRKTDSDGNSYYVTRTGTGTDSGTVSGKLLVNGTGVNSLAQ